MNSAGPPPTLDLPRDLGLTARQEPQTYKVAEPPLCPPCQAHPSKVPAWAAWGVWAMRVLSLSSELEVGPILRCSHTPTGLSCTPTLTLVPLTPDTALP